MVILLFLLIQLIVQLLHVELQEQVMDKNLVVMEVLTWLLVNRVDVEEMD